MRSGRMCVFPLKWPNAPMSGVASLIVVIHEKPDLRRIARWCRKPQMCESSPRHNAAARRALHEALLQKIGLDDLLDRIARFAQGGGDRLDADWAAAERFRDQLQ